MEEEGDSTSTLFLRSTYFSLAEAQILGFKTPFFLLPGHLFTFQHISIDGSHDKRVDAVEG